MNPNLTSKSGLVQIRSQRSFADTVQALRDGIAEHGLKLFTIIDHSGEAAGAGLEMPPTQVFVFGSPKGERR